jgi:hypothetical protein
MRRSRFAVEVNAWGNKKAPRAMAGPIIDLVKERELPSNGAGGHFPYTSRPDMLAGSVESDAGGPDRVTIYSVAARPAI